MNLVCQVNFHYYAHYFLYIARNFLNYTSKCTHFTRKYVLAQENNRSPSWTVDESATWNDLNLSPGIIWWEAQLPMCHQTKSRIVIKFPVNSRNNEFETVIQADYCCWSLSHPPCNIFSRVLYVLYHSLPLFPSSPLPLFPIPFIHSFSHACSSHMAGLTCFYYAVAPCFVSSFMVPQQTGRISPKIARGFHFLFVLLSPLVSAFHHSMFTITCSCGYLSFSFLSWTCLQILFEEVIGTDSGVECWISLGTARFLLHSCTRSHWTEEEFSRCDVL